MDDFITWKQVRELFPAVPASRSARQRWVRRHGFPQPCYATPNRPLWRAGEVENWFASRPRRHIDAVVGGKVVDHAE